MTLAEHVAAEKRFGDLLAEYADRWVAVRDHQVVVSADSLEELIEQIEEQDTSRIDVFHVAEDSSACFY